MEVILLKDVRGLGAAGQVKNVSPGYARNYLIPRGLAAIATSAVREELAQRAGAQAKRAQSERAQAEQRAADFAHIGLTFRARAGELGRLYGSITAGDIAERLSEQVGQEVDKRKVQLDEPIKELGVSEIEVKLHPGVSMTVTVTVEAAEESE